MGSSKGTVVRWLTIIMGTVIALTFLFGFGNVLSLALRLGVPLYVAPLVAPAVGLSVLGLLLGTRYLALQGAAREQLRPALRLLLFVITVTLALNVAEPLCAGQFGKAAFDAVRPLLLIGWSEVGPTLLHAIQQVDQTTLDGDEADDRFCRSAPAATGATALRTVVDNVPGQASEGPGKEIASRATSDGDPLTVQAYELDAEHWTRHQRPIAADTLRRRLGVGSRRACALTRDVRSTRSPHRRDPQVGCA